MASDPQPERKDSEIVSEGPDRKEEHGSLKRKKERAPRLDLKLCRFTEGCREFIGMEATMCPACGGGTENARGKTSKECPNCGEAAAQQAHVCRKCGHKYEFKYRGNVCPECERSNPAHVRFCQFCTNENGEKVELREKRENKKPGLLYPRKKPPFQPSASKPGTVIRALADLHVFSVRRYDTGPGYRCACLFDTGDEEAGRPPRQICNRLECLQLAQFSKGAGEAETDSGEPLVGFCEHLELVKEALEVEANGGAAVEGPLKVLSLQERALDGLIASQKVSTDTAKKMRASARELKRPMIATARAADGARPEEPMGGKDGGEGFGQGQRGDTDAMSGSRRKDDIGEFDWRQVGGTDKAGGFGEIQASEAKGTASLQLGQPGGTNGLNGLLSSPRIVKERTGSDQAEAGGVDNMDSLGRARTTVTDRVKDFKWGQPGSTKGTAAVEAEGASGARNSDSSGRTWKGGTNGTARFELEESRGAIGRDGSDGLGRARASGLHGTADSERVRPGRTERGVSQPGQGLPGGTDGKNIFGRGCQGERAEGTVPDLSCQAERTERTASKRGQPGGTEEEESLGQLLPRATNRGDESVQRLPRGKDGEKSSDRGFEAEQTERTALERNYRGKRT